MEIETVKIVSDVPETGGFIVINKADFDEKNHKIYQETKEDGTRKELEALAVFYKLAAPSVISRWALDRLKDEVAKAQAAAEEGKE